MNFARLIPDWNSLESVRHTHSVLEFGALVFFALLVIFDALAHLSESQKRERILEKIGLCFFAIAVLAEIAAYPYGQRNDTLSEALIGSLDAKARQASADAAKAIADSGKAVTDSGTALSQAEDALSKSGVAVEAMNEAQQLKGKLADRTLSDSQLKRIAGKLAKYVGQEYGVTAYWDSPESMGIANRIHFALQAARWKYVPPTGWEGLLGGVVGIKISVHPDADTSTLAAAQDLTLALQAEGLQAKEEVQNAKNNPKSNKIGLVVGSKM